MDYNYNSRDLLRPLRGCPDHFCVIGNFDHKVF